MAGAWLSLLATLAVFAGLWVLSVRKRDCGVVDLYWSWGFAVIGWMAVSAQTSPSPGQWLLLGLVTVWSARLGVYLLIRHLRATGEDARYRAMRDSHGEDWVGRSFWMVFMLQAVVLWIVASPVHVGLAAGALDPPLWLVCLAGTLFIAGFALEAVADAALLRFRQDPANRGKLLTTGVFAWSRHPNYFGESVLWWGLGLLAYGLSGSLIAFVGPLLLTLLLVKVSGVPMLEDQLRTRPGFADYAARTSSFVPMPPAARAAPTAGE